MNNLLNFFLVRTFADILVDFEDFFLIFWQPATKYKIISDFFSSFLPCFFIDFFICLELWYLPRARFYYGKWEKSRKWCKQSHIYFYWYYVNKTCHMSVLGGMGSMLSSDTRKEEQINTYYWPRPFSHVLTWLVTNN